MSFPFSLVLHTHLPMVVNHGRWPHGSDWLNEAHLRMLPAVARNRSPPGGGRHLAEVDRQRLPRARPRNSPPPEFQKTWRFTTRTFAAPAWRAARTSSAKGTRADRRRSRTSGRSSTSACGSCTGESAATSRARSPAATGRHIWRSSRARPPTATCRCSRRDESIHLQLRTAVESHSGTSGRRHGASGSPSAPIARATNGRRRRRRSRSPPAAPARASRRCWPPMPRVLRGRLAPGRGRRAGLPVSRLPRRSASELRDVTPSPLPVSAKPRHPTRPTGSPPAVAPARAIAFIRDPRTTLQVWSREHGYPGDTSSSSSQEAPPCGLRFSRITDSSNDLGTKLVHDPRLRPRSSGLQAATRPPGEERSTPRKRPPGAGALPDDSELFGHWWFEGPLWLEHIGREMAKNGVRAMTLGEAITAVPPQGGRCSCPRARGARAAITGCGSTARRSGRGIASTAPSRSGSSSSGRATAVTPSSSGCWPRPRASSCSCRPRTGSSSSPPARRATTPSAGWPSTTRTSSG